MSSASSRSFPNQPIPRNAAVAARKRLAGFPILTITGPRQSGKTTLSRLLAPDLPYFSLEDPDTRALATEDPRAFLRQASDGAILDEIQRAPELFSYLQGVVDSDRRMGRFILTGSSQFELIESITQSLAGRSSMLTLLPFSLAELQAVGRAPATVDALLHAGLFPPIHDRPVEPTLWLQDYISTYLERDVRQILNIQDLATFQRFVQLCAGRVGQLLNITSLAADTGITRVTAESWLSVLQASHLVFLVRPWFSNLNKRLIKTPKLYFCDPGLAAWLLGVRAAAHLSAHPQRGALFENWVMTELLKAQTNLGLKPSLHFLRDKEGHEIDALIETAPDTFQAVEIKSGETIASDFFTGLDYWRAKLSRQTITPWLIHGGIARQDRAKATVLPWNDFTPLLSQLG
ncbi:MAG: ATP-binding protein [Akkermansiaceae bacterium]|nr:ATP-binding protein [Akkermansiaceae bacterium]MCF7730075.1 ATP-binding protein [Akkermansiaceae bacterium]